MLRCEGFSAIPMSREWRVKCVFVNGRPYTRTQNTLVDNRAVSTEYPPRLPAVPFAIRHSLWPLPPRQSECVKMLRPQHHWETDATAFFPVKKFDIPIIIDSIGCRLESTCVLGSPIVALNSFRGLSQSLPCTVHVPCTKHYSVFLQTAGREIVPTRPLAGSADSSAARHWHLTAQHAHFSAVDSATVTNTKTQLLMLENVGNVVSNKMKFWQIFPPWMNLEPVVLCVQ